MIRVPTQSGAEPDTRCGVLLLLLSDILQRLTLTSLTPGCFDGMRSIGRRHPSLYTCRSTVRDLSPVAMLQLGASALVGMLKAHVAHARLIIGTHSIREPCNTKKLTKTMKWRICVVLISVLLLH